VWGRCFVVGLSSGVVNVVKGGLVWIGEVVMGEKADYPGKLRMSISFEMPLKNRHQAAFVFTRVLARCREVEGELGGMWGYVHWEVEQSDISGGVVRRDASYLIPGYESDGEPG